MVAEEFSWLAVVPSLVGGGISAVTAVLMFSLAQRVDRKKRESDAKKLSAVKAFSALQKIMHIANINENLARQIDREFKDASETREIHQVDPAHVVRPLIGAPHDVERITPEEILFLAKSGNGDLIAEIWEIQQRTLNNDHLVKYFNELKTDYADFMESCAESVQEMRPEGATLELKGTQVFRAVSKTGRMNTVLVGLVSNLESDRVQSKSVVERFLSAAVAEFGSDFPAKTVEWKENAAS
ncbi:MAG: hypothetical protein O9328_03770 [Rhodobacteraceae bacterium]|nr:hypothetical protein [Paracoccaceae bacterium]